MARSATSSMGRLSRGATATLLMSVLLATTPALAQDSGPRPVPSPGEDPADHTDRLRERWERLSPEKRAKLAERLERFKSMSSEERAKLRERFERYRQLPEEERHRLTKHLHGLQSLDPSERKQLLAKQGHLNRFIERYIARLDPADQEAFKSLSVDQQREKIQVVILARRRKRMEQLMERLSPEQRERLQALPEEERRHAAREVFHQQRTKLRQELLQDLPAELRDRIRKAVQGGELNPRGLNLDKLRKLDPEERRQQIEELLSQRAKLRQEVLRDLPAELRERLQEAIQGGELGPRGLMLDKLRKQSPEERRQHIEELLNRSAKDKAKSPRREGPRRRRGRHSPDVNPRDND